MVGAGQALTPRIEGWPTMIFPYASAVIYLTTYGGLALCMS